MLNSRIILCGYSGHGLVVADAINESDLLLQGYIDLEKKEKNPFGLQYLGTENNLSDMFWKEPYNFIIGIGDNALRSKLASMICKKGGQLISIFHPSVCISKIATIGRGTFISANVIINPLVTVSENCIINTGAIIEHECEILANVHIAPGAVLAGNVQVGENSFIGANSIIKQGVKIGKNVIVGAGSVVLNDIPDNKKIVGNPGKEI
ncbi:acetyltransferase [Christiangramia sediminis]|uniref:Acetyltransferase n=1 Tax=Christiangramia sediminis TaxID=2881336 RepID=A0A9X1LHS4_9FLAO|nr:acetyltransferase [Christiangramia sediminis]